MNNKKRQVLENISRAHSLLVYNRCDASTTAFSQLSNSDGKFTALAIVMESRANR